MCLANEISITTHEKPPRFQLGGFSVPIVQAGLKPRLVAFFSSVKPFAEIVADYPRQDGEQKRD